MVNDLRIAFDFLDHPKTVKLKKELGADAILCLMKLWSFAGKYRQKGNLTGMTAGDIALAAGWEGSPEAFIGSLLEVKYLEKYRNGQYKLHNWRKRNSYLYFAPERSAKARKAIKARWDKGDKELGYTKNKEPYKISNTPLPTPTPTPYPYPTDVVEEETTTKINNQDDNNPEKKKQKGNRPVDFLDEWSKTKESIQRFEDLACQPGYEREWIDDEFNKFRTEVLMKPDWAVQSRIANYDNDWGNMFFAWLKRARRGGERDKYYQRKR